MPASYHAFAAKAKSTLFLLRSGLPGLADAFTPNADMAAIPDFESPLRPGDVLLCGECDSSLDVAMHLAQADRLPEWASVLACSQRAGRGQLRRPWVSPPGNIYAAIHLPAKGIFSGWNAALAVGWMLALALRGMGVPAFLKWPNDLLLELNGTWSKFGGILLEERGGILLAGVGLNVAHAPTTAAMRRDASMPATTLQRSGYSLPMLPLWMELVQRGQFLYADWSTDEEQSRVDLRSAEAVLAWKGRTLCVDEEYHAVLQGLDAEGRLHVTGPSGELFLTSGTIRLAD